MSKVSVCRTLLNPEARAGRRGSARAAARILAFVVLTGLAAAVPSLAGTTTATQYSCTIGISPSSQNCTEGVINLTFNSGAQRVARINLSGGYLRLDAFADVCSPSGWWLHFGDSPTNDGGGGDAGTTTHDAETYDLDTSVQFFGTFNYSRGLLDPYFQAFNITPATGCFRVQWSIMEGQVLFNGTGNPSNPSSLVITTINGFEHAPYLEPDSEDPNGTDANFWYTGINRTIFNATRSGVGVDRVCYVLSKTTAPTAASLSAFCP
jgi:hypothetical protein